MFQLDVSDIVLREHARRAERINRRGWMFAGKARQVSADGRRLRIRGRGRSIQHPALEEWHQAAVTPHDSGIRKAFTP